jgi:tetratricopeptide (TPR) repeat protein
MLKKLKPMKKISIVIILFLFGVKVTSFSQNLSTEDLLKQQFCNECSASINPSDADYSMLLKAMQTDSMSDKLNLLTKFMESNHENGLADDFTYKGLVFNNLKQYDSALAYFNQAIKLNQADPFLFYFRGDTYSNLHNYIFAINDFSKAINLDQSMYMAFYFRGICYYVLGDVNKALNDISKTFQLLKASNKTA